MSMAPLPAPWRRIAGAADTAVSVRTSVRDTTNTVLVHRDGRGLLIDPGWEPAELDAIATDLEAAGITVEAGLSTHAHHDHVLWHPRLGDAPRYASPATIEVAERHHEDNLAALGDAFAADVRPDLRALVAVLQPHTTDVVAWTGPRAEVVVHDGHSPGHVAVFLRDIGVLVAGDMLSDVEIPLLYETGPAAYAAALDRLEPVVARSTVVVPGHGHAGDPVPRLAADRAYLAALANGGGDDDPRITTETLRWAHAQNLAAR